MKLFRVFLTLILFAIFSFPQIVLAEEKPTQSEVVKISEVYFYLRYDANFSGNINEIAESLKFDFLFKNKDISHYDFVFDLENNPKRIVIEPNDDNPPTVNVRLDFDLPKITLLNKNGTSLIAIIPFKVSISLAKRIDPQKANWQNYISFLNKEKLIKHVWKLKTIQTKYQPYSLIPQNLYLTFGISE